MRCSRRTRISRFALAVLALALLPLIAVGQGTVQNVTATSGAPSPAWAPYGEESDTTLSVTQTAPTPDEGSTLVGPNYQWTVLTVEYSDDGVNFVQGGSYQTSIQNANSANAILQAWFYQGAYWRITCQVTVSYSETPGASTWTGTATCKPLPNSGELVSITVTTGATQVLGAHNWAAVKMTSDDKVFIVATVNPSVPEVSSMIQWTNGAPIQGDDNTYRTVDKGTSVKTAVQAQIGTAAAQEVDIWIIWATVTIQITGNIANDNNAPEFTNNAGDWRADFGGGTALGAIDHDAVPGLTYAYTIGKIQATGKLTPPGIGNVVSRTAWKLKRTREDISWDNGGHYTNKSDPTTWAAGPSNNDPAGTPDTFNLDAEDWDPMSGGSVDTIYCVDAPGCSTVLSGITIYHTSEGYSNFTQFVTVTLGAEQTCSDNAYWSYQARVDGDKPVGSRIDLNKLDTQLIDVAKRKQDGPNYAKRN